MCTIVRTYFMGKVWRTDCEILKTSIIGEKQYRYVEKYCFALLFYVFAYTWVFRCVFYSSLLEFISFQTIIHICIMFYYFIRLFLLFFFFYIFFFHSQYIVYTIYLKHDTINKRDDYNVRHNLKFIFKKSNIMITHFKYLFRIIILFR